MATDTDITQSFLKWRCIYCCIDFAIDIVGDAAIRRVICNCDMVPLASLYRICRREISSPTHKTSIVSRGYFWIDIQPHTTRSLLIFLGQDNLLLLSIRLRRLIIHPRTNCELGVL